MTIVVSNKQRIHFVMEGERGAFLILHHGLFGSHRDWGRAGFVEALANDFRVILPDARGHGRSDRPVEKEAYALGRFSEDLIAIMNELDIRNAHFVGYSLGALVGLDLVMRHPERVRLIMLGGEAPVVTEEARAVWRRSAERIRAEGFAAWAEAEIAAGRLLRERPAELEGEQDAALALLEAMAEWEVSTAEQFQVSSPITIFSAEEDPAHERTQRLARRFQRARFIPFPALGHRSLVEGKAALLEALLRFIKITRRPPEEGGAERRERSEGGGEPGAALEGRRGGARGERPWHDRGPRSERPWRDERREEPGSEGQQGEFPAEDRGIAAAGAGGMAGGNDAGETPDRSEPREGETPPPAGESMAGGGSSNRPEERPGEPEAPAPADRGDRGDLPDESYPAEETEAARDAPPAPAEDPAWENERGAARETADAPEQGFEPGAAEETAAGEAEEDLAEDSDEKVGGDWKNPEPDER